MSPEPADHPSPDQWLAYHRGELSEDEEARLQEHLVRCRDCFDLAEAAAAFAAPDEAPGPGQEVETAAAWRLLRPQLDPSPENVRAISAGRERPSRRFRLPTYLAASFFVALVGMTFWNLRQQSDIEAMREQQSALEVLRAPKPNAPVIDFSAGERQTFLGENVLRLPPGPSTLVFHPNDELSVYRLAFSDVKTGQELDSYELRLDEDLALTLQLPEGLPPGRYRLELSDPSSGRVLETHLVRVAPGGGG